MALGSLDQSVSVWITGQPRPLLVARDVFERQVMDLSWCVLRPCKHTAWLTCPRRSSDGLTLYACSADGRIAVFIFTEEFLAPLASDEALEVARQSWGWQKTSRAASQASVAPSVSSGTMERPNVLMARKRGGVPPASKAGGLPAPAAARPARLVQVITRDAKGRRRIRPTLLSGEDSSADDGFAHQDMDIDMSIGASAADLGFKRPAEEELAADARPQHRQRDVGRTLGGELARTAAGPAVALRGATFAGGNAAADVAQMLPTPALMSVYRRERPEGTLEARNSDGARE
jgi:protein HIRA/HIR1